MKSPLFLFFLASPLIAGATPSASFADTQFACRNAWGGQKADVDGPVLSVKDLGSSTGDKGRYRIVVRDHFTGCRVGDMTNSVCKVGQHASIVGGSFGDWTGDDAGADSDYPYQATHIWDCE